ncbi:MAG: hypothetical protein CMO44_17900, partial [Verrucomicrobiales bacterium]|nr:hypothetical protein [Verrucomicrobiales bacterium]
TLLNHVFTKRGEAFPTYEEKNEYVKEMNKATKYIVEKENKRKLNDCFNNKKVTKNWNKITNEDFMKSVFYFSTVNNAKFDWKFVKDEFKKKLDDLKKINDKLQGVEFQTVEEFRKLKVVGLNSKVEKLVNESIDNVNEHKNVMIFDKGLDCMDHIYDAFLMNGAKDLFETKEEKSEEEGKEEEEEEVTEDQIIEKAKEVISNFKDEIQIKIQNKWFDWKTKIGTELKEKYNEEKELLDKYKLTLVEYDDIKHNDEPTVFIVRRLSFYDSLDRQVIQKLFSIGVLDVCLLTEAGIEGTDFKSPRESCMYTLRPNTENGKMTQFKGRLNRLKSHDACPEKYQKVTFKGYQLDKNIKVDEKSETDTINFFRYAVVPTCNDRYYATLDDLIKYESLFATLNDLKYESFSLKMTGMLYEAEIYAASFFIDNHKYLSDAIDKLAQKKEISTEEIKTRVFKNCPVSWTTRKKNNYVDEIVELGDNKEWIQKIINKLNGDYFNKDSNTKKKLKHYPILNFDTISKKLIKIFKKCKENEEQKTQDNQDSKDNVTYQKRVKDARKWEFKLMALTYTNSRYNKNKYVFAIKDDKMLFLKRMCGVHPGLDSNDFQKIIKFEEPFSDYTGVKKQKEKIDLIKDLLDENKRLIDECRKKIEDIYKKNIEGNQEESWYKELKKLVVEMEIKDLIKDNRMTNKKIDEIKNKLEKEILDKITLPTIEKGKIRVILIEIFNGFKTKDNKKKKGSNKPAKPIESKSSDSSSNEEEKEEEGDSNNSASLAKPPAKLSPKSIREGESSGSSSDSDDSGNSSESDSGSSGSFDSTLLDSD